MFCHFDAHENNATSEFVVKWVVKLNGFAWKQCCNTAPKTNHTGSHHIMPLGIISLGGRQIHTCIPISKIKAYLSVCAWFKRCFGYMLYISKQQGIITVLYITSTYYTPLWCSKQRKVAKW